MPSVSEGNATQPAASGGTAVVATEPVDPWARAMYTDPDVERHPAVRLLRERLPGEIVDIVRFRDETTIHVQRESLRDVCALLRDDQRTSFAMLTDVTAVDMLRLRAEPRFD